MTPHKNTPLSPSVSPSRFGAPPHPSATPTAFRPLEPHEKIAAHHANFAPGSSTPSPAFKESVGRRQGDTKYAHFEPVSVGAPLNKQGGLADEEAAEQNYGVWE